jgi:cation diffusion facilitator family transporter
MLPSKCTVFCKSNYFCGAEKYSTMNIGETSASRQKDIYKVTLAGGAVNVVLLAFKFVAGILGHSAAMIADAVHSLSDFITDLIVLIFVYISGKPQDKSHDYGHGKYETLALTIIGIALLVVAVGIFSNGAQRIAAWYHGQELEAPGMLALWAALLSILLKELTYRYTIRKARQLDSPALEANAWHHRSDALSSIGTAVGIGGAVLLGKRWTVLDPVASIVVGAFIVKVAIELILQGMRDLLEHSLPDDVEDEIMQIAQSEPDVIEPHDLRTRRIGNRYAIELHILMNGDITLSKAHDHADSIENQLKKRFGENTHVAIHMEPAETEKPT